MKNFKCIEASIIGLLIGVVVSVYILFMDTTGRDIGNILQTVSLNNLLSYFPIQYKNSIIFTFLFYIVVYMLYTVIFNLLFRMSKKMALAVSIMLFLLGAGSIAQQVNAFKKPIVINDPVVEVANLSSSEIKKYFGEETRGDLNQDQVEDIAFLIKRNENDERGDMYYLSVSLKTNQGYEGLNLLYIGEKIKIDKLSIEEGIIHIQYIEEDSEEIMIYKAWVENKILIEIKEESADTVET